MTATIKDVLADVDKWGAIGLPPRLESITTLTLPQQAQAILALTRSFIDGLERGLDYAPSSHPPAIEVAVSIVKLPISRDLYSLFADAAQLTGDTMGVWIRQRCEECARQELAEHEQRTSVSLPAHSREPR